jgi:hypothetical protein
MFVTSLKNPKKLLLTAAPVRSIGGKPFLTRRCSGLTHKAASTAELIR